MTEAITTPAPTLAEAFHLYERLALPSGDAIYSPPRDSILSPAQSDVMVSPIGESLLQRDQVLLALLSNPRAAAGVTRRTFTTPETKIHVAVKRIHIATDSKTGDPPGTELFGAIRDLEAEGITCAMPIAATQTMYVSEWIKGSEVSTDDIAYREFMVRLMDIRDKFVANGRWDRRWVIDILSGNVRQKASSGTQPAYVVIDPIAQMPNISHADFVAKFNRLTMEQG